MLLLAEVPSFSRYIFKTHSKFQFPLYKPTAKSKPSSKYKPTKKSKLAAKSLQLSNMTLPVSLNQGCFTTFGS